MDPKRLPGPLKAAILVHAGGESVQQKLFPMLEAEEKKPIAGTPIPNGGSFS